MGLSLQRRPVIAVKRMMMDELDEGATLQIKDQRKRRQDNSSVKSTRSDDSESDVPAPEPERKYKRQSTKELSHCWRPPSPPPAMSDTDYAYPPLPDPPLFDQEEIPAPPPASEQLPATVADPRDVDPFRRDWLFW